MIDQALQIAASLQLYLQFPLVKKGSWSNDKIGLAHRIFRLVLYESSNPVEIKNKLSAREAKMGHAHLNSLKSTNRVSPP